MLKTIFIFLVVTLLVFALITTPKNTLKLIKNVSMSTIDLVKNIIKDGKPIIEDIYKTNENSKRK